MKTRLMAAFTAVGLLLAACGAGTEETGPGAAPAEPETAGAEDGSDAENGQEAEVADVGELTALMSTVTFQYLPVLIAQDIGAFENHGLTVNTLDVQGASAAAQAMAAGEGQVTPIAAISIVTPILRGLEARIIGSITNEFSSQVMVTSAASDMQGPDDLHGGTIGVVNRGGLLFWLANQLAQEQGWEEDQDYELAALGGLSEQLAGLEAGVTDAFIWTAEAALQLEENNDGRALFDFGDIVHDNVNVVLAASSAAIAEQPEALEAFMRGWLDTIEWMRANEAETVEACMRHYEMSEFVCQGMYDAEIDNFSTDGVIPEANLQGLAETMVDVDEELTEPPAITEFYDPSFVGSGS